MEFNLRGFWDVFTWQVNWLDANFFWVIASLLIYGFILFMVSFHLFLKVYDDRRKSDARKKQEKQEAIQNSIKYAKSNFELAKSMFAYFFLPLVVLYLFVETLVWLGIID